MNTAIDNLMSEHQLILQALASLNTLASNLQKGGTIPRQDIADFTQFFRDFADKCHHCKEEDRLFVMMSQFGFPKEYGPVAVMLAEHNEGRDQVRALSKIGAGTGPLSAEEARLVIDHAGQFVQLLSAHIAKEDAILYPMARNAIPADQLAKLDVECVEFEQKVMAPGEVLKLRDLASRLNAAYPADMKQFAAATACFACH